MDHRGLAGGAEVLSSSLPDELNASFVQFESDTRDGP